MAPRALARRPTTARWRLRLLARWGDRPSSHTLAGNVKSTTRHEHTSSPGTTNDEGQDVIYDTGLRQTAVDDTTSP